jgi:molybdate transport system substrate-binding protein
MAPHLYFHMMQFRSLGWIVVWYLAYAASSATPARAADVIVFAAASMAGAMDNLIRVYSRSPATRVRASYASSSTLAKQIVNGAPADVFVSANPAWMDYVDRFGAIISSSRFDLLSNRLVLVTSS